ncbi:MAG: glycosyltransferase [Candidatus Aminicenantes bacterium]|nr:glycosyltransferase [Candidatus Aminicenantes bacterium]
MDFLQVLILFFLLLLFLNLLQNIQKLKAQRRLKLKKPLPLISILIPARNEERNIKNCISSLLRQNYPNLEIIVLDDNSSDQTYTIAEEISRRFNKLSVIKGEELPPGWNGKNWACHQLSRAAKGDWLLFTDADTTHRPNSISTAVAAARKNNSVFVTLIPGFINKTWSEKLVLPIIHFAFLVLVPFKLINYSKDCRLAFAIGPFMLIKKDFYASFGGYEAIKKEIVDDFALAKTVKQNQGKITILDGTRFMKVRFYINFRELWYGLSKNTYAAIGSSPHYLAVLLLGCYFLFIYPYFSLWWSFESNQSLTLPLLQVLTITGMKVILAKRFKTNLFFGLLHPLTVILTLLILLNSFRLSLFKKKIAWKERLYPIE